MTAAPPPDRGRPAPRRHPRIRALILVPTAATALALGLSACGGGSSASSTGVAHREGVAAPAAAPTGGLLNGAAKAADAAGSAAGTGGAASPGGSAAASPGAVRARLIRTAQVTIELSGQLEVATAQVRNLAKEFGGHVESETTGIGDTAEQKPATGTDTPATVAQRGESLMVLRVPEPKLDDAIRAVTDPRRGPGGKVLSQTSSSQDVTGDIADLTSRVASQRASLDRIRTLMAKATSLQDVVTLESELSRRQSDLEALEARLATVSDQADLSTLTVLLRTPSAKQSEPDTGFLAGLKAGWHAVQVSTKVVLTVLGAVLPIAVIAVVIGWPVWRLTRRRSGRPAPPPAPGRPFGGAPGHPGAGPAGPAGGGPGSGSGPGSGDGPDTDDAPDGSGRPQPVGAGSPSGGS